MDEAWGIVELRELSRGDLEQLAESQFAGIRIPSFLTMHECGQCIEAISSLAAEPYDLEGGEPVLRIGLALNDYAKSPDRIAEYFRRAPEKNLHRADVFSQTKDPFQEVLGALAAAWSGPVSIAEEKIGQQYFAGVIRTINSSLIHIDWSPYEYPGLQISSLRAQLAWNVYLRVGSSGGGVSIYDRSWDPALERYRLSGSYGYSPACVNGIRFAGLTPAVGDLLIFNSRNAHQVLTSAEKNRRLAIGSFIGITNEDEMILWS